MRNGTTATQNDEGRGWPVTRIETISDGTIDLKKVRHLDVEFSAVERWRLKPGDIVLSHINSAEHIGKSALYRGQPEILVHGMNLLLLRPDISKVLPEFLHFGLRSAEVRKHIRARCKRAINQASINQRELSSIELRIPDLEQQHRVVDLLSRAENIVRMRLTAEQKAKEVIPALFLDMFGDPATNPKGWEAKRIDELTTVGTGGTPSRGAAGYYGGDIPWVKTGEVDGTLITSTEETLTAEAIEDTNCKVFPRNTILIAMYGQGQTRGRAALLGLSAATNQACAAILPTESIETAYLYQLINIQYERLRAMGRGGNQANLNLSMIKAFRVPVPPRHLQRKFSVVARSIEGLLESNKAATLRSNLTFNSLLSGVFVEVRAT